jgi:hypothetical protein
VVKRPTTQYLRCFFEQAAKSRRSGSVAGTRRRQHRYSWEAVGATWEETAHWYRAFGPKQSVQQLCATAFPLHTSSADSNVSFSARPSRRTQPFSACAQAKNASSRSKRRAYSGPWGCPIRSWGRGGAHSGPRSALSPRNVPVFSYGRDKVLTSIPTSPESLRNRTWRGYLELDLFEFPTYDREELRSMIMLLDMPYLRSQESSHPSSDTGTVR